MSCITGIGRHDFLRPGCDKPLRHTSPPWTQSKMNRLEAMALSESPFDRQVAANHPKCPADMLLRLLMDENVAVRRAAVRNPNVTQNLLMVALNDSDLGIRAYVRLLQEDTDA